MALDLESVASDPKVVTSGSQNGDITQTKTPKNQNQSNKKNKLKQNSKQISKNQTPITKPNNKTKLKQNIKTKKMSFD